MHNSSIQICVVSTTWSNQGEEGQVESKRWCQHPLEGLVPRMSWPLPTLTPVPLASALDFCGLEHLRLLIDRMSARLASC